MLPGQSQQLLHQSKGGQGPSHYGGDMSQLQINDGTAFHNLPGYAKSAAGAKDMNMMAGSAQQSEFAHHLMQGQQ